MSLADGADTTSDHHRSWHVDSFLMKRGPNGPSIRVILIKARRRSAVAEVFS